MNNEIQLEAIIEDYLNGNLSDAERLAFEQLRRNDPSVDQKVVTHKLFLDSMSQYAAVFSLKAQMDQAHQQIDVDALTEQLKPHSSRIVRIWRNNRSAIAIAASFLILAGAVLLTSYSRSKQDVNLQLLDRKISQLNRSQNNIIRVISNDAKKVNKTPAKFGGTGFAVSSNGYILTNFHVIKGADSLYVQNSKGNSFKVRRIYEDPGNDIAILKVVDESFTNLGAVPYSIKKSTAGIGEQVYTLGYPKDDVVLGDGYVASKTGINGDTLSYQVAIPVNPGNSGGPLIDNNGNIVGIINGKEDKTDGAAFAVKSKYILEALEAIPQDSLNKRVSFGKKTMLQGMKRHKQVEKIQDYIFMIKVYN